VGRASPAVNEAAFDDALALARSRVGSTLNGKWRLDHLLGVGGMAAVYEATHRNRKRAAVKILHPEFSMNLAVRQRFLREGYVANSVGQSGAVAVDDDDVAEDGCAFLVMELLDGETLDARWERKGKHLPPGEVLSLVDQVLSTLSAAHAAGIVHRDLKPENMFLTRGGAVKILDFGIARLRELSQSASKTQTGSMMGTPSFMPPEQARGRWDEVDAQSDLWAVGATMFTLLTGRYVHEASTVNEALAFAVTQPARSISMLLPDLPFPIVELVDRALAYDKNTRWSSAATMQGALRRAYTGLEAAALAAGEPPLEPITLERDEASGTEGARTASIDSDIPASPLPLMKPGLLTTARGVTHNALAKRISANPRAAYALAAAVAVAVVVVAAWLGRASPSTSTFASSSVAATQGQPPKTSSAAAAPVDEREPARVTLEQLPVAPSAAPNPLSGRLHVGPDLRRPNTPTVQTAASRTPPQPRAPAFKNPSPGDDPFASRR